MNLEFRFKRKHLEDKNIILGHALTEKYTLVGVAILSICRLGFSFALACLPFYFYFFLTFEYSFYF